MYVRGWAVRTDRYWVTRGTGLFVTIGFLTVGVVWSLVVLPRNDMRPSKVLGVGLIVIYGLFLSIRISMALGVGSVDSLKMKLL